MKAARIVDQVYAEIKPFIVAGRREKEIAYLIRQSLKKNGAERPSFRIIVASGWRSAIPHGYATNKTIKNGDAVVIDFGAVYNGIKSDLSRTVFVGKPTIKQRTIYQIVINAQNRAARKVKAGIKARLIDQAAREYIEAKGFGRYFVHSTGHGIGKKVHQAPKISKRNNRLIKDQAVVTVEPGIYIKNWGGVRVEDMYLVTRRGAICLTRAKK